MKGVIPTPDIAKIFHPTPDIEGKNARHPTFKIYPDTRHPLSHGTSNTRLTLDTVFFKSTSGTVKYLISTLDNDPPFKGPVGMTHTFPKSGRSIDYPLTKIRLHIPDQGLECRAFGCEVLK